ncbi:uncharacterized protein LOC143035948 [Oratosquilla oratoria]|uniref:uncharacterized protein LOC143035948 n=1 Tax=Oratosquilla oratoria TaxID=337810 RepID=UPI003F7741AB
MHALSFVLLGAGLLMVAILCFYIALNIRMYAGYGSLLGIPPSNSGGVSISISMDNESLKEDGDGGGGGFDKGGSTRRSCKKRLGGDRIYDKGERSYMKGGGVMKGYCNDVGSVESGISDKKVIVCDGDDDDDGGSGCGASDTC